jgi:hypothetical protein
MKACYDKAYTAARLGADHSQVAEIVSAGVERDIRRDGGTPAFSWAVDLIVLASQSMGESSSRQLLAGVDGLRRDFADASLTRYFAAAAETIGVAAINEGRLLSRMEAAQMLLVHFGRSRCCDGDFLPDEKPDAVRRAECNDSSVLLNLLAADCLAAIAADTGWEFAICPAVRDEAKKLRDAATGDLVPLDIAPLIASGLLQVLELAGEEE